MDSFQYCENKVVTKQLFQMLFQYNYDKGLSVIAAVSGQSTVNKTEYNECWFGIVNTEVVRFDEEDEEM